MHINSKLHKLNIPELITALKVIFLAVSYPRKVWSNNTSEYIKDDFMIPGDVFVNTWVQYIEYAHNITLYLQIFWEF